ncbi:hypothetical protein [Rhodoferax sp.]|uniref:hypothetical protein n=1 Tax=Rhodoferax sp. TaxID=50421 RepID=UPI002ACD45CB|nr:hypothetical protein [Rhodoferax sp.]MDZ7920769.1 hypothetical protein [Rhodoferax sp.]
MQYFRTTNGEVHALELGIDPSSISEFPKDAVRISQEDADELRKLPPPTSEQIAEQFIASIQNRLDDFARQRNYDSILSACTYATSAVAKFKAEGHACVNLRDATWAAAYDILGKVHTGQRPMPSSLADIEADLPALVWPA